MGPGRFVSYLRVSTDKQGRSGLGLEAQRKAVTDYLGTGPELISEFVEVESGRKSDRPELGKALAACRVHRATLLVAKLDRLSRDAHFLLGLKNAGVEFVAVDMPSANRLTVGILAMVAEEEARLISVRTRSALQAAKARGVVLGRPNLNRQARQKGTAVSIQVRKGKALQRANDLRPVLQSLELEGVLSAAAIARSLSEKGVPAPRGGKWSAVQVSRLRVQIGSNP